jgi:hypothetical protein
MRPDMTNSQKALPCQIGISIAVNTWVEHGIFHEDLNGEVMLLPYL